MDATIPLLLKATALFTLTMGTLNTLVPHRMIASASSSPYTVATPSQTLADSHLRYWAAAWASTGAILWWASDNLEARRAAVVIVAWGNIAGGVGRLLSGWRHGMKPKGMLRTITALEIGLPVLLLSVLP